MHNEKSHRDQRALAKGVDPILVPQQAKEFRVQTRLEDLHIQRVVLICVNTKVFNLVEWNALIFRCRCTRRRIPRRISAKGADVHSSSRDCTVGINLSHTSSVSFVPSGLEGRRCTTTATNGSWNFWLLICVLTSIPESQQPYPG